MFTGIIQTIGEIIAIEKKGTNIDFTVKSNFSNELKIDQSIAHNGVCLTVIEQIGDTHKVTAIKETLDKTTLNSWTIGAKVNLEKAMMANAFLDGHLVQGHVDQTAICEKIEDKDGSKYFYFEFVKNPLFTVVDKGSICIDGTSLTIVETAENKFSVAIIPYTLEHTIFHQYTVGTEVNIEFDILGKYIDKILAQRMKH